MALCRVPTAAFRVLTPYLILRSEIGADPTDHRFAHFRKRVALHAARLERVSGIRNHDELVRMRESRQFLSEAGEVAERIVVSLHEERARRDHRPLGRIPNLRTELRM